MSAPVTEIARSPWIRRHLPATIALVSIAAVAIAGGATAAVSQNPEPAVPVPNADRYAPDPEPDRVVLTPTEDPAHSQAVSWRTSGDYETAYAQITETRPGPSDFRGGPQLAELSETIDAETVPMQADLGYMSHFHTAVFENLQPETAYVYRVGDGANWSEWYEFTTAADGFAPFSFIYYGDAQNDIKEHVSRVFRRAYSDRPEASLTLHAGDLVDVAPADHEWGEWFEAAGWINGVTNVIATPGNHEYRSGELSPQWRPNFNFPSNGPTEALDEVVYYVDYQGVRFISLDSNRTSGGELAEQAEWLDDVLADNDARWTVIFHHHPIFSVSTGRDNTAWRNAMLPVIQDHDVDLVLAGHDHTYGRGNLSADESPSSRVHNGAVYAVSVSGPKMYDVSGQVWGQNGANIRSTGENLQLYQLIDVEHDRLTYEARTADGELHDGFQIRKQGESGRRAVIDLTESQS